MTLQSSGAISMSQMRDEYGLSNPVSLSQFYGKNGLPSSGVIRFSDFYGKSNYLDQQTVIVGSASSPTQYGFMTGYYGSISDGTSNIYGGAAVEWVAWQGSGIGLIFKVTGATNSGWTYMKIKGTDYYRTSASWSGGYWRWSVGNPFTNGETVTVIWY